MKATTGIIRELCHLAAFKAQLYIFTKVEKAKADLRYSLIEEQFHGCIKKRIKRACSQLIEGTGASIYSTMSEKARTILSLC